MAEKLKIIPLGRLMIGKHKLPIDLKAAGRTVVTWRALLTRTYGIDCVMPLSYPVKKQVRCGAP